MLSQELREAVTHIQSHAHQLRAIITIADAVTSIETLEQAANEAENRRAAVETKTSEAESKLKSAEINLEAANADLAQTRKAIAEAKKKAAEAANEALAKADADAQGILDKARASVSKAVEDEQAKLTQVQAELAVIDGFLEARTAERIALEETVTDLEARADRAKKYLAKLTKED
jgi:chromosome segregation ATPase